MIAARVALIAHGGAARWWLPGAEQQAIDGMRDAVRVGQRILRGGGAAIDAVCAAVVHLEDNSIFNAATGASLNFDGFCELDACLMESVDARVGAVAALQRVRNPILVARKVLEETDHAMLAGEGAQRFARSMGFADYDPVTPARRALWQEMRRRFDELYGSQVTKVRRFLKDYPWHAGGTVGAVAVDAAGILAAASSTGGYTLKLAGRVGDTPIAGAGTYATPHAAVTATGTGEYVMRSLASRAIADKVAGGRGLDAAVGEILDQLGRDYDADVGFIAVDREGRLAARHRTPDMPHAYFIGDEPVVSRIRVP